MATDKQTPDLFAEAIRIPTWDANIVPRVADTAEITELYNRRPGHTLGMSMAVWFCNAHGLEDRDFRSAVGTQAIKLEMIRKGYVGFPLKPLEDYNNRFNHKERQS